MKIVPRLSARNMMYALPIVALAGAIGCGQAAAGSPGKYAPVKIIYSFTGGADGGVPYGQISFSKGNLVGTTYVGGSGNQGTVFSLTKKGQLTTLHNWTGGATDGEYVNAGVVADADGNLYGMTGKGGTSDVGIVYKLDTAGVLTVLHSFSNCADGGAPLWGRLALSQGTLYGVTSDGRTQSCPTMWGTAFQVGIDGANYKVLHNFDSSHPENGYSPTGTVSFTNGVLFGTTQTGGAMNWGSVFQIDAAEQESPLYSFKSDPDGSQPFAGPMLGTDGRLFGTTQFGGKHGAGTVFAVDMAGTQTVLHSFTGKHGEGKGPTSSLVQDADGNLFGTTYDGGTKDANGTVFEITNAGTFITLHKFKTGTTDGQLPLGGLAIGPNGDLYGTTIIGGSSGEGTVFKLTLNK